MADFAYDKTQTFKIPNERERTTREILSAVYSALLEKTLGEKVTMTKNFEITFERNGKERSEKHLSSGVKSICALCFRLALIKNMYRETSPFLILDDPFVFLDEEHFSRVSAVIKELSRDMQIIYFTCHDSRVIKNGD